MGHSLMRGLCQLCLLYIRPCVKKSVDLSMDSPNGLGLLNLDRGGVQTDLDRGLYSPNPSIPSTDCNQKHAYLNLIVTRRIQVNYCFSLRLFSGISVNLNGQELIRKKILPRYRYPYQHLLSNDCYRWDYKLTLEALYIDHIARAQP
jgi:hypothetical protein